jgi:HPt (histidine-containing phosphotransfer) domain-containing protein
VTCASRWGRAAVSDVATAPRTVFDPSLVSSMTGHADDLEFAYVFVTRFRRLLPGRVSRIQVALAGDDYDHPVAMDAVLSLKVSACTLGASELCSLSRRIEEHLRSADLPGAREAADELGDAERRAESALSAFLSS